MFIIILENIQFAQIPSLFDFEIIKAIGKGGFSKVFEVRKKDTGMIYAMKVIDKKSTIETDKVQQMMCERNILSKILHPFIIKLHYAFQSVLYYIT